MAFFGYPRGHRVNTEAELTRSDGAANDSFGYQVSLDLDTVVIGALRQNDQGEAYVFTRSGTVWTEQQKAGAFRQHAG
jgi:hypothetical protein